MEPKIWNFAEDQPKLVTPYEYLIKYADMLEGNTGGVISGTVTETVADDKVVLALYLVVPKLRNYMYRLLEVVQQSVVAPYPVEMRLFGLAPGNMVQEHNVGQAEFEAKLVQFIQNPLTQLALSRLRMHLDIKQQYQVE